MKHHETYRTMQEYTEDTFDGLSVEFIRLRDRYLIEGEMTFEKFLREFPFEIELPDLDSNTKQDALRIRALEILRNLRGAFIGDVKAFPEFAMGRYKGASTFSIFFTHKSDAMLFRLSL